MRIINIIFPSASRCGILACKDILCEALRALSSDEIKRALEWTENGHPIMTGSVVFESYRNNQGP